MLNHEFDHDYYSYLFEGISKLVHKKHHIHGKMFPKIASVTLTLNLQCALVPNIVVLGICVKLYQNSP